MFVFGSGVLIGTQLNVPNPTPINFGLVQKVTSTHRSASRNCTANSRFRWPSDPARAR